MASLGRGVGVGPPSPRPSSPRPPYRPSTSHTCCRAVLLGLPAVGKTALTVRLLTKRFIGEYCPTLESLYCYRESVENEDIRMEIFDTAGVTLEDAAAPPEAYLLWANCFLLVYAINDRRSFDEAARLKRRIDACKEGLKPPCVLVGNKSDLEYERRVRRHEGQKLARLLGCTHFFETSARDGDHVGHIADMFHTLFMDFRRHRALLAGEDDTSNKNGGRSAGTALSSGARHKAAPTSAKFRHAIQKVMSRSKAPSCKASSTTQINTSPNNSTSTTTNSLVELGLTRESIV